MYVKSSKTANRWHKLVSNASCCISHPLRLVLAQSNTRCMAVTPSRPIGATSPPVIIAQSIPECLARLCVEGSSNYYTIIENEKTTRYIYSLSQKVSYPSHYIPKRLVDEFLANPYYLFFENYLSHTKTSPLKCWWMGLWLSLQVKASVSKAEDGSSKVPAQGA